jgi:hypothetical protein
MRDHRDQELSEDDFDTSPLAVPEQVSVAMEGIAEDMREGLLALAGGCPRVSWNLRWRSPA